MGKRTLGKTGTQQTRNLLDETLGSDESIVLACELFDELLVLVQLLEVLSGHAVKAVVLSTVKVVLVTKNTITPIRQLSRSLIRNYFSPSVYPLSIRTERVDGLNAPDGHVGTRDGRQTDGTGETLVTLGVVVLQTDLKLDGLEEVSLLLILRVVEQLLDILAHSGCSHKCHVSLTSFFKPRPHNTQNTGEKSAGKTNRLRS